MRFISIVLLLLLSGVSSAQETRLSFKLQQLIRDENAQNRTISVLIKGDVLRIREEIRLMGGSVKYSSGNICSANIPVFQLHHLANLSAVERVEEGHVKVEAMNDKMLINNKIDLIHAGTSPLTQGYDGKDVVVGVIDTGLDFTHPDFKDSLGQSRVLWIWDHLLPNAGNTPALYGYGQEFSKATIDAGNANAHVDATAHGTHVAGIATANGDSLAPFKGAAPKSDIIAVSLDFNQSDDSWLSTIADAVDYIFHKADSLNKPCVINISAGTYIGSHDGLDLQAQAIDNLVKAAPGRMVVAAAGNAGNYPLHVQHQLTNDSTFTWFRPSGANPVYIEFWADTADLNNVEFRLAADKTTPTYEERGLLNWTNITPNLGQLKNDTIWSSNGNRLAVLQTYGQLVNGRYSMIYYILPDSTTYLFRLETRGSGSLDCWSFDMVSSGLPAPSAFPKINQYTLPDYQQNICSSFQCSDVVICVGQYVNRNNYIDVNGNLQTFPIVEGNLAASSSRGPTRDGRTKPDITSTGEMTLSALKLSSAAWFLANQPFKLAQGGMHIRDGGTSSAAPAVAGAIALYLQKNPTANWLDIRNRVLYCSTQDNFTGTNLPDNMYGHGKLDAFAMMNGCSALAVSEQQPAFFSLYPNPATDALTIRLSENIRIATIQLWTSNGALLKTFNADTNEPLITIPLGEFESGIYFITCRTEDGKTESHPFLIAE